MTTHEIAADLREAIASGHFPRGSRLPSVRDLAHQYGVSHQTVASAYADLASQGLVHVGQGRAGTMVIASKSADAHLGTFAPPDLTAALPWKPSSDQSLASSETVQVRQMEAAQWMVKWGIEEGTLVMARSRIRSADGAPVQHKLTVVPYEYASCVPEGEDTPPMMAPAGAPSVNPPAGVSMANWLGWDTTHTECVITVEPMMDEAAQGLGLPVGTPGFCILGIQRTASRKVATVTVTTAPLHHRITLDVLEPDTGEQV